MFTRALPCSYVRMKALAFAALLGILVFTSFSVKAQPYAKPQQYSANYLYPYPHPYPTYWKTPYFEGKGGYHVFNKPMLGTKRLDFCYKANNFCGRVAANEFCQRNGYQFASRFAIDRDIGQTRNIGTNETMCRYSRDGFLWIRCRNM